MICESLLCESMAVGRPACCKTCKMAVLCKEHLTTTRCPNSILKSNSASSLAKESSQDSKQQTDLETLITDCDFGSIGQKILKTLIGG